MARPFAFGLRVSQDGVWALTLGGLRRISWERFDSAKVWTNPDVFDRADHRSFAAGPLSYLGGRPFTDGVAFWLTTGPLWDRWLTVSETLTVEGQQAIRQICDRTGIHLPKRHESPNVRELARNAWLCVLVWLRLAMLWLILPPAAIGFLLAPVAQSGAASMAGLPWVLGCAGTMCLLLVPFSLTVVMRRYLVAAAALRREEDARSKERERR
ncbi:hypothetical protein LLH03_20480 [bacterium]|nr:hypothetical protein [bacterium]